jgi:hypothetical protein
MTDLHFHQTAAGYDRSVGVMTHRIVPLLLRAARLAPGMRVLDIHGNVRRARGRPGRDGQAIARTAVVPEAVTRMATLGCCFFMMAAVISCMAAACSRVSQNRTEAPRAGLSPDRM